ncbi:SPOR domain-containing protein [Sphingomonas sp. IC081]|uniref:SPOR domain-containing protein n=1 Tax=Sphingomonas sp. IC081 TaxID=304378 RepID=UPI00115C216C|nr:SPOR domain-containing protein [Sphingomonas sp. IC081]QDK32587.1 sporulation protein SsgA [Sphingomonas sp. IC081]
MRLPVSHVLPFAALIVLVASPLAAKERGAPVVAPAASGPAADYPVVVGEPFTVAGTTWTPADQLNYDAVGYATTGEGKGVTAAHKTLPLPSYAEVTALGTGRTILVRIERRGPMVNDSLVELSGDAAAQLGVTPGSHTPIRIRRVNPPEAERALLRSGTRAPERMATPEGLLGVLRRKLAEQSPLLPPPSTPPRMPTTLPLPQDGPVSAPAPTPNPVPRATTAALQPPIRTAPPAAKPTEKPTAKPAVASAPSTSAPRKDGSFVQVGAFSVEANARKVAAQLGGSVSKAGKLWRVRLGPFQADTQAAAALRKAQSAGYKDARIQRGD